MATYNIQAVLHGDFDCVPQQASEGAAGYDLCCSESLWLYEKGLYTVKTGISLAIPKSLCGLILPRSSLHKHGLSLANTIGLIDSDYRGEIILKLQYDGCNLESPGLPLRLHKGVRLAQLLFLEQHNTYIDVVRSLGTTERGQGGFGSTGGYGEHSDNEVF